MSLQAETGIRGLRELVHCLHRLESFGEVTAALSRGESAAIDGAWGSSCALTAAALAARATSTLLIALPRIGDIDDFALDASGFLDEPPLIFPAWETLPQENDVTDAVFGGRLRVLRALEQAEAERGSAREGQSGSIGDHEAIAHTPHRSHAPSLTRPLAPPRVIITSIAALLQPVPSRAERREATRLLRVGHDLDFDELLRWLVDRGFERVTGIALPGEFSMHGGILDIFPPDAEDPLRFEFFGDEIESIRRFDVETQRKLEVLDEVAITLVRPVVGGEWGSPSSEFLPTRHSPRGEHFAESLPPDSWIALVELPELVDEGNHYLERLDHPRGLYGTQEALARYTRFPSVTIAPLGADSMETTCHLQVESIERFTGPRNEVLQELASAVGRDERVLISCHNEGEQQRLSELLAESGLPLADRVQLCVGHLSRGFRLVAERLVVLSDNELFGRTEVQRTPVRRRRPDSRAIDSFLELNDGDLVVHLTNGIARYRGMKLLEKEGQVEEHLNLEFRDKVHVYVPVSLIHLVQKYIGGGKFAPELSKLGTTSWAKKKDRVAEAVRDLASDMLRLQAAREAKPGISYPPDSHWQLEFEASFPYTETPDQLDAILDCKQDLERMRPMDRLICGDVGYGKTEVALRAAFKVIDSGRQVAVLVPTTVLAEQHYRTFTERLAEYPVTVESISRFKTKGEQRRILEAMESGAVDIVIGTHRLVQKDVQFKDLGLLIIDEEQRFGVEAKEMLKRLRLEVDVLTLSATPIPRTLHMALLGIRDISNLQTPPLDRTAIATHISRFDGEMVRQAIVRELNRGGQVYFVHNRVYNIQSIADRLQQIVPEASIGVGHGQMKGDDLEAEMLKFVTGQTDILVCTTIIESGLDIPNANTMFIHQADKYGLADLHQLRGRVGRSRHRAYCYLLLEEGASLTPNAAKRMKAIEEFSELGAGFKIAMRDLEIRGAGNILGTEQSGHIASVGYELYCRLLENAVRKLKNEPMRDDRHVAVDLPVSAFLPLSYVPPGRPKIEMYRKLSNIRTLAELQGIRDELRDRFGPLPDEAERLLQLKELQLHALAWDIDDIHREERFAVLAYRDPSKLRVLRGVLGTRLRVVDSRRAYLLLPDPQMPGEALLEHLKSVLQPK